MKPEELLDPETLPEDLRWLVSEFKLQPRDPVFLLIAWHWHRVQSAEDSLRAASLELQTAVDTRVGAIAGTAEAVSSLVELLARVQASLEQKPALLSAQLDAEIKAPLAKLHTLEQSLDGVLSAAKTTLAGAQQARLLATLLIGVTLGLLAGVILSLP
jgi:hypothetical protein